MKKAKHKIEIVLFFVLNSNISSVCILSSVQREEIPFSSMCILSSVWCVFLFFVLRYTEKKISSVHEKRISVLNSVLFGVYSVVSLVCKFIHSHNFIKPHALSVKLNSVKKVHFVK